MLYTILWVIFSAIYKSGDIISVSDTHTNVDADASNKSESLDEIEIV